MITRIWQRLSLGSLQDAKQLSNANPLGFSTVLSLCPEEPFPKRQSINYVRIPIADSLPIPPRQFVQVMREIAKGIRRGHLFVHCVGGMSRSPVMCAAWMALCGYAAIDAALAEIAELRPIVDPSPVLFASAKEHLCR
jgi:protein-tyrosine phosphatase